MGDCSAKRVGHFFLNWYCVMNWVQAQPVGLHVSHYKFLIKNVKLGASSLCGVTHPTPAVPFLLREKEPKAYQRGSVLFDISSGGSIPRGCRQAAKPPPLVKNSRDRRGARDRSAVTAGAQPPGISKGCPLRHVFGYFYREIKVPAVWSA